MTSPNTSIRYWANSRASSGTTVRMMAARMTPTCEPMPPSTTMDRISADSMNVNDSRSEEHTSELQSLMRISYAVFCLKKISHLSSIIMVILHYINHILSDHK